MPASDDTIVKRLRELLEEVDLATTSEKKLRQTLEAELDEDLSGRKALIREEVQAYLERQDAQQGEEENGAADADGGDADDGEPANGNAVQEEEEPAEEGQGKRPKKARGKSAFGSRLSPEMQEFLGRRSMPRTQVVKKLWEYIKANNLQNPKNKQKIILDDKLKQLFKPPLTMLNMNKQLSKHCFAGGAPDIEEDDEEEEEDGDEEEEVPAKKKQKTAKGSLLSPELQEFLGVERMAPKKVFSRIWDHVKKNGLQDPADRDTILLDDQLSKLFSPPATIDSVKRELSRHVIKDQ